jgi:ribose 1,5-bisphosphate isomerase
MSFEQICKDIKSLKIQGATNVAKSGVQALKLRHDPNSVKKIISLRPTEPALRNAINFSLKDIKRNPDKALKHFDEAKKKIAEIGAREIPKDSVVFTHCHASTVTGILKNAFKTKKFEVYCTETRPMFQGRKTATELAKAKIPVTMFVDSAARYALKNSDIMLLGADAILSSGKVANKIGSELFAETAKKYDIPVFVCTDSWKFDPMTVRGYTEELEIREAKEVWSKPPKGVKINNIAFELIDHELITGIISELGIYNPETFVVEVQKAYPWMFENAP